MTKTTIEVVSDTTQETHHYHRRIVLRGAKKIKHKDKKDGLTTTYTARSLTLGWNNGEEPTTVTIHGDQENAAGQRVIYRRTHSLTKAPNWVKEILDI